MVIFDHNLNDHDLNKMRMYKLYIHKFNQNNHLSIKKLFIQKKNGN